MDYSVDSKCPKCGEKIDDMFIEPCEATARNETGIYYRCLKFICPHCGAVLGVQLDPSEQENCPIEK